ncbi:MAG TPA: hypothetical protein VFV34_25720, partial [Blastocatellia bacterium]|nr:hypothetical protein [Blastocatellia bacterium]
TGRKELMLLGHNTRVNALAWSPDGHWLASTDFVGNVILWDAQEGKRLRSIEKLYSTDAIAISPDGLLVATTHGVYDSGDGHEVVDFRDNTVPPWLRNLFFKFSSDGRRLIGMGSYLTIIDATTWQVLKCSDPINSNIVAMDLAPDERRLVTGDIDGSVRLWDVETLKETAILGRHAARVKSVAFSPDGAQVASAGDDKAIIIWDVHSRTEVARVGSHGTPVLAVAFSPDGNKIVSGEHDNSVHVYTRHGMLWGHRLD